MYEAHFHLARRPFVESRDLYCFFAPERIQAIIEELTVPLENGYGIAVLTGPDGVGRTAICRQIAARFAGRRHTVHFHRDAGPDRRDLWQAILIGLGGSDTGLDEAELRQAASDAFAQPGSADRGAVLIVDDAQFFGDEQLDELRQIGSTEGGGLPPARLLLAGGPSLEQRLSSPELELLSQQVMGHVCLEPWSERLSLDYVAFQVAWAGGRSSEIFTPRALERIAHVCNGLPACINILCDHVLLLAFAQELTWVTEETVDDALIDVQHLPLAWNSPVARQSETRVKR
jgi:type II secretory pathway predicted ATPase ExeA